MDGVYSRLGGETLSRLARVSADVCRGLDLEMLRDRFARYKDR